MNAIPVDSLISGELSSGERLLWSGQPRQGIALRRADVVLIPFSLVWGGFAFFWEYSVLSMKNAPVFFALWGVPFVLVGVYIVAGRFFVEAWQRQHTVYAVTSERVLIMSGITSRNIQSLSLRTLSDVSLEQAADGSGTVTFGTGTPWVSWASGAAWPGMPRTPSFEQIPDARAAYDIILKAQGSSREV